MRSGPANLTRMPAQLMTLIAALSAVLGLVVFCFGTVRYVVARRSLARESVERPMDESTGLPDHRAFTVGVRNDIRVARRHGGNVWIAVVTIADGDADAFGVLLADAIRMPERAYRLAPNVFCVVRMEVSPSVRADVLARIDGAAARARIAIGEASWPGGPDDPVTLLHAAIDSSTSIATAPAPVPEGPRELSDD